MKRLLLFSLAIFTLASNGQAQETQTYSYDAKGRLIKVERTGGPQDGADSDYSYDPANNRTSAATTGARTIYKTIILPLNGFTIIPIEDPN